MSRQKYLFIPNEGMPKSCWECPCLRHDSLDGVHKWQCNLTYKTFDAFNPERLKDCPLQEVWLDPEAIAYGELKKSIMSEWIPVSERLPRNYTDVLVTADDGEQYMAFKNPDDTFCFYEEDICDTQAIAWMPLPEPYKENPV